MNKVNKFLKQLPSKQKARLQSTLNKIAANNLSALDVKPMAGQRGWYRCRVGAIRIIFIQTGAGRNIIYEVNYRGSAYKK